MEIDDDLAHAHTRDLIAQGLKAYALFETVGATVDDDAVRIEVRRLLRSLVDFLAWQEIRFEGSELLHALTHTLALSSPGPADAVQAWSTAVQAALPTRAACRSMCLRFPDWCAKTRPEARTSFIEALTVAAPFVVEWGDAGVQVLREGVECAHTAEKSAVFTDFLRHYRDTDAAILLGAARTARAAVDIGAHETLNAISAVTGIDALMESRDACRFLPTMCDTLDAYSSAPGVPTERLLRTILGVAESSLSSAYGLCRGLLKARTSLSNESVAVYADTLADLIGAAGPRTIGFGVKKLPKLFRRLPPGQAEVFAHAAARVAGEYGIQAAEAFLDGQTPSAARFIRQLRHPA